MTRAGRDWKLCSAGPQEGLNRRTIGKPAFQLGRRRPQPQDYWQVNVSARPQEGLHHRTNGKRTLQRGLRRASAAELLENKQFLRMPKPGQGGPQEGLNRKSIGKQTVCVGAEAWPRWASRGPQPQNYWKTNGFCDCWNHLEARPTRDLIILFKRSRMGLKSVSRNMGSCREGPC